jgi:hypothetical protein
MNLRDYFAGKAMQAFIISGEFSVYSIEDFAIDSYKMSDAMLKARAEK